MTSWFMQYSTAFVWCALLVDASNVINCVELLWNVCVPWSHCFSFVFNTYTLVVRGYEEYCMESDTLEDTLSTVNEERFSGLNFCDFRHFF